MICHNKNLFILKRLIVFTLLLSFNGLFLFAQTNGSSSITPQKVKTLLTIDKTVVLLDVRTAEEFAQGHIQDAKLLPYDTISVISASLLIPSKENTVIVYCRSGRRSSIAQKTLQNLGYKNVFDLGGINNWPYEVVK